MDKNREALGRCPLSDLEVKYTIPQSTTQGFDLFREPYGTSQAVHFCRKSNLKFASHCDDLRPVPCMMQLMKFRGQYGALQTNTFHEIDVKSTTK